MRDALAHIKKLLVNAAAATSAFADKHKCEPTLAYTHFQSAQPTTVGKRATLWLQDLILDIEAVEAAEKSLRLLGCKGTTGTGASFLELFGGDYNKVKQLEALIAEKMGFEKTFPVSGQTYTRKLDYNVLSVLAGIAQSAAKFSNDIRLLSHLKEFDEPFEEKQIGSSAMAYKRNPMRSERIASLARYVMIDVLNPAFTAATQWFERTLDDSANRRISIPEAFLATDAILTIYINVIKNGVVYPKIAEKHLRAELPFMATENIMMHCVQSGGDRQEVHEIIRQHSVNCAKRMKETGCDNDLFEALLNDPRLALTQSDLDRLADPMNFVGCAPYQTEEFLREYASPVIAKYSSLLDLGAVGEVRV